MDVLEAAEVVLRDEGGPLHYRDLLEKIFKRRLWTSEGQTPEATLNSRLSRDIQEGGTDSRFIRVAAGTFDLREVRRQGRKLPTGSPGARPQGSPHDNAGGKLNVQDIRALARQIVRDNPEGIKYGQLVTSIVDRHPATPRNTVEGSVWNLDAQFPDEVHKPLRGLFKPLAGNSIVELAPPEPPAAERLREELFYKPFADWLMHDIEDATVAVPLGGSTMRAKWGTPDVIGVYKPLPSDRIKFPPEIVSAEIKVEPQAPVVAFGQAVAYRLFSTKTYIVMPRTITTEDRERLEALCLLFGVGLVLFTLNPQQPDFSIRMRAQRFSPDMYFVNEFADGLHRHSRDNFNQLFQ